MKYVWQAARRTGALWLLIAGTVLSISWLWLDAKVLQWTAEAVNRQSLDYVWLVVAGIAGGAIFECLFQICRVNRHMIFTSLSDSMNDKLLDADVAMFLEMSPGKVVTIAESTWQITMIVENCINMVRNLAMVVINCYFILRLVPEQWPWFISIALVLSVALLGLDRLYAAIDKKCLQIKNKRNVESDEIVNGFMEVRTFSGARESHRKSIHTYNKSMIWLLFKRHCCNMVMDFLIWLGSGTLTVAVLLFGITAIKSGLVQSATVLTLTIYISRLCNPFCNFVFGWDEMSEQRAKLPDFNKLMSYEPKIKNGSLELDEVGEDFSIKFDNVGFAYDKSSNVIRNVSMTFERGKHYGICGVSGGGKSTLLKLLNRFYDPDEGSIQINGIDIKKYKLESIRKHFGCVHQDVFIFAGTIRDNIAYALKPMKVSDEKIIEACQKAGLWNFIQTLKDGLDTKVGNRGLRLSGGQQQRIALARLFLADPEVIILDEATSALDNETERIVQQALDMFHDKTIIAVAHRLSTIRNSDMIYVMVGGKIEEFGSHDELVALDGVYAKMLPKDNQQ